MRIERERQDKIERNDETRKEGNVNLPIVTAERTGAEG